ncbi:hypothetical protein BC643_1182 [Mangrovibacterium diazotrophicum]|uniref:Uncharacterized protein n=1 Tax=Mangrovibacterium diazotrophicum TaxID=1261403 RepID=A0A419W5U8_9BACT|nr:hypothetical protein BC643_1182 [Mangrovibacterium diazotrophicum]
MHPTFYTSKLEFIHVLGNVTKVGESPEIQIRHINTINDMLGKNRIFDRGYPLKVDYNRSLIGFLRYSWSAFEKYTRTRRTSRLSNYRGFRGSSERR